VTEFTLPEVAQAIAALTFLVIAAVAVRRQVRWLRVLYVPNAVTAGVIGLLIGPQVLGKLFDSGTRLSEGVFGPTTVAVWTKLPGLLINVVFAAILLGKHIPSVREIWRRSATQALFGATLSFGQYALGLLLAVAVLVPVFGMSPLSGALLEISFSGGHGTAAGLTNTMTDHGFAEGSALALGLATVGLLGGILIGTLLVNRAVRSDNIHVAREDGVDTHEASHELDRMDTAPVPEGMDPDPATSPLTVAVGAILLAILIGWVIQQALIGTEALITGKGAHDTFMSEIPLFPFTIIGGALLQLGITARGWSHLVPRALINQVAGLSLDLLITAAIATLSLSAIGDNLGPFLLMMAVGFAWSIAAVLFLAPRFYGSRWFERAIGDFGQSCGTVASGFLLIDMADPASTSGAKESYGYKQLLYEPFFGGGLITALAIPIVAGVGATAACVVACVLTLVCIFLGVLLGRRARSA
jgi:ESS family glutamate:Na+ symporter